MTSAYTPDRTASESAPCDLYRFYDADGALLYVGISLHAAKRASEHRKDKPWWGDVARMEIEHFASRRQALEAEEAAIKDERPRYNVVHNRQTAAPAALCVTWHCDACGEPIAPGAGYVQVDTAIAHTHRKWWAVAPIIMSGDEIMNAPRPAAWDALHRECDEFVHGPQYWIAVEQIATYPAILRVTDHLASKNWFQSTDWTDFVARRFAA